MSALKISKAWPNHSGTEILATTAFYRFSGWAVAGRWLSLNRRFSRILILNAAISDVAQGYPKRTSDFNSLLFIDVHGLAIRGVACPDHSNASNPKPLFSGANRPAR